MIKARSHLNEDDRKDLSSEPSSDSWFDRERKREEAVSRRKRMLTMLHIKMGNLKKINDAKRMKAL